MEAVPHPTSAETKLHFLDYWRIIRIRKMVILAVFLLVVTTTTVVSLWLPKKYASSVRMQVDKDVTDVNPMSGQQAQVFFDPYYIQTQFERIQDKLILYKVIEELGLNAKWAERYGYPAALTSAETFDMLSDRMRVSQVRNTSVIEVRVLSEDPEEAAAIANKIAEVYQDNRKEQRRKKSTSGVDAMRKDLDAQTKLVENARKEVERLRKEGNISDLISDGAGAVAPLESEIVRRMEALRAGALENLGPIETKLNQIKKLTPQELRKSLNSIVHDNNLALALQSYDMTMQKIVSERADLTEDHPEMIKLNTLLQEINKQIEEQISGIMGGLESQLAAAKKNLEQMTKEVDEAKQKEIKANEGNRAYASAKRYLETQEKVLQVQEIRFKQESFDAELPVTSSVEITGAAEPSLRPVRPNITLNIALGVIVGLIAGIGLAFFIEYLDTSVKTIDDVEQVLQSPVLSVIPQGVGLMIEDGAESPHAEAYRVLRTNVLFSRKDQKLNTITIVSGGAEEGKSTTVFNLATVFAQNGQRVLLVDSDLRRPSLHKLLKVSNTVGLTNYLLGQNTLEEVIQTTRQPGLDFLPSGKLPSSSLGILSSQHMKDFVRDIKSRYNFVFFDAPPLMGVSDASILVSLVDMTLLVIQHRKYPQAMNVRAKHAVDKVGGNLLGVVLNNINISQDAYYYYYSGYYYDHYTNENKPASEKPNGSPVKPGREPAKLDLKQKY